MAQWEKRLNESMHNLQTQFQQSLKAMCEKNAAAEAERLVVRAILSSQGCLFPLFTSFHPPFFLLKLQAEVEAEHESYKAQSVAAQAEYSECELAHAPYPFSSHLPL